MGGQRQELSPIQCSNRSRSLLVGGTHLCGRRETQVAVVVLGCGESGDGSSTAVSGFPASPIPVLCGGSTEFCVLRRVAKVVVAMQHPQGAGEPLYPYADHAPTTMGVFSVPPPPTTPAPPASGDVIPLPTQPQPQPAGPEEFHATPGSGSAVAVNPNDDDMMMADVAGGAGGSSGNRWPREETLALIRIRSEMDAAFRNATLKAPVWEELSRRLAELGYQRSAKKCKEKFENVDKYYKRTKEGRAGRQDGKSYRFFSQLEALHAAAPPPSQQQQQGMPVEDPQPLAMAKMLPAAADLGFLSMSSDSESDDESDEEEEEDAAAAAGGGDDEGGGISRKMMAMFEGMMRQVTEKQDAMQRAFMETLEKWESVRTESEEAWRRKEVARMNREREILSQERAAAASRDAALIAFLQRLVAGEHVKVSPSGTAATRAPFQAPPPSHHDAAAAGLQLVPRAKAEEGWAGGDGTGSGTTAPSRWPKEEVQALIDLRMEKEEQYSDMGPKGPLWEEIAAGMQRIGYNRSAKRCKEKWENINKYFKKVKESNKRRPDDSKTCPYFHQLDAIYSKKRFAGKRSGAGGVTIASASSLAIVTVSGQESQRELEGKSSNDGNVQLAVPLLLQNAADKAEGTEAEPNITAAEETDSDEMGGNYTDDGDDDDKMQYKIEFQKPNASSGSGSGDDAPAPTTTAAATSSALASNTSFLAVQ
ncbi:trihelix transcription factor GTL1-like isoform X2 [Oryza brachyantha]|uniref:trihelix transcription factor GTL1-like isoform X2 n=1 Tax=Oryza brachyantha TaxID=4533 RepID=UPI00077669F7|nr:trihelix transcription factor GTL1-like isoform X2 [Oryza brachyantha]